MTVATMAAPSGRGCIRISTQRSATPIAAQEAAHILRIASSRCTRTTRCSLCTSPRGLTSLHRVMLDVVVQLGPVPLSCERASCCTCGMHAFRWRCCQASSIPSELRDRRATCTMLTRPPIHLHPCNGGRRDATPKGATKPRFTLVMWCNWAETHRNGSRLLQMGTICG